MNDTNSQQEIIICRDVHKWFDHFHVLKGISLTVQKGEVIVIFGPSGSGKSTFIRTLNRNAQGQTATAEQQTENKARKTKTHILPPFADCQQGRDDKQERGIAE